MWRGVQRTWAIAMLGAVTSSAATTDGADRVGRIRTTVSNAATVARPCAQPCRTAYSSFHVAKRRGTSAAHGQVRYIAWRRGRSEVRA